jgi:hypothetical protein
VIGNPVADLANGTLQVVLDALRAGQRPDPLETFFHHIPFVPQTTCCRDLSSTSEHPFGEEGFLSASVASAFPATAFPTARGASDEVDAPSMPSVHLWIRLWRCFTTLDGAGAYDIADATTKTEGLAQDLAVVWAGLQRAVCTAEFAEITNGCRKAVLWEARPVRIQAGCAGWDFHVIATWPPLLLPAED